jgi:hypothetical protein
MTIAHIFGVLSLLAHVFLSVVFGTLTGYVLLRIQPPGARDRVTQRQITEIDSFRVSAFSGLAVTMGLMFLSFRNFW